MDFLKRFRTPKTESVLSVHEIAIKQARLSEIEKKLMEIQSGVLKSGQAWDIKSGEVAKLHAEESEIQKELAPYVQEAA